MKTMQEVQTLISDLQQFYTDVRLLDAATIERIEEGVRSNPNAEELCYACRHRNRRCHHCAVKSAFESHDQRTKLEYFSPDIGLKKYAATMLCRMMHSTQKVPSAQKC